MANCTKCGAALVDGEKFCGACGTAVSSVEDKVNAAAEKASAKFEEITNTTDTTSEYTQQDIESNKAMAILSYLFLLVFVPIFAAKESKYARFHANQGLVLTIAVIAFWIVDVILSIIFAFIGLGWLISIIGWLVWVLFFVFEIIGLVNASQGKAKELPIIGKIRILK